VRGYRNSNAVEAYDPATDTWDAMANMLSPRHALAAVTWNDTIFTIGGDADAPFGGPNVRTNIVEAYDLVSNTWSRRASSPMALHYHPVALAQGRIYAFEGDVAAVLSYDPERDAWTRVASKPHVRWAEAAAGAYGRIYLFGGWNNPNFDAVLQYNEEYDPAADPSAR
jgi:N-acetylneuraminic acid mutarotase